VMTGLVDGDCVLINLIIGTIYVKTRH